MKLTKGCSCIILLSIYAAIFSCASIVSANNEMETQNDAYMQDLSTNRSANGSTENISSRNFTIKTCGWNPLSGGNCTESSGGKVSLDSILTKLSELLLYFIPIIMGISFMVSGYYYILSSGDSEKASQAKTIIKWNIVAVFVAFMSYAIISLLAWVLGSNL